MDLLFVGGVNRSGSTLLQKILTLHSDIEGGPEFDFMPHLMRTYRQMQSDHHLKRQSYFYDPTDLRTHWRSFIRTLLGAPADADGPDGPVLFSEKTPNNVFVADHLLDLFPSARFVYIYRDGRAVVNSLLRVRERYERRGESPPFDIHLTSACREWIHGQATFDRLRKQFAPHRIHSVCYEDLIRHPAQEIEALMGFLGMAPEPQQRAPGRFSSNDMNTHVDDRWYTEDMYTQSFNTANIDKWEAELSAFQRFVASVYMAEPLAQRGYAVAPIYRMLHRLLKHLRATVRSSGRS